jgi:hypothetical protein
VRHRHRWIKAIRCDFILSWRPAKSQRDKYARARARHLASKNSGTQIAGRIFGVTALLIPDWPIRAARGCCVARASFRAAADLRLRER